MVRFKPRFGVWAPYRGPWLVPAGESNPEARFALCKDVAASADRAGFDAILFAQHTINPFDPEKEIIDAWTFSAAAAALTQRIEIIAAIKPLLYHPVVLAKQALGIEDISQGRFAINFVNGWFKTEMESAGIRFPDHDDRYGYGSEWLRIFKALVSGERVNVSGKNFQITDYQLRPRAPTRRRPYIYSGGESEPARQLAVELSDAWLITGIAPQDAAALVADIKRRPRAGTPLEFGTTGFVLARPTDREAFDAIEELYRIQEKFNLSRAEGLRGKLDPQAGTSVYDRAENRGTRYITAPGDTLSGFIGSYDRVAWRIAEFYEAGIDFFLTQFYPMVAEQERFAAEVIPRALSIISHHSKRE